jgi:hypothetical protein
MSFKQLNPPIPMCCPQGNGYAIAVIDYSQEHDLLWVIAINDTGEIWTNPNSVVRMLKNISIERFVENGDIDMTDRFDKEERL